MSFPADIRGFAERLVDKCYLVERIQLVNALDNKVVIRDEDGHLVTMQGYHIDTLGECSTHASVEVADKAAMGDAEGRFMRDVTICVGERFDMLLRYRAPRKNLWFSFGKIATIAVCPPDDSKS